MSQVRILPARLIKIMEVRQRWRVAPDCIEYYKNLECLFNMDNKERGRIGLITAISYFGLNGYTISIPLNDTQ